MSASCGYIGLEHAVTVLYKEHEWKAWMATNDIPNKYIYELQALNKSLTKWSALAYCVDSDGRLTGAKQIIIITTTPAKKQWLQNDR